MTGEVIDVQQRWSGGPGARLLSFAGNVAVETEESRVVVVSRWGETVLEHPRPPVRALLARMTMGPVSPANVLGAPDGDEDGLGPVVERLAGCVEHSLTLGDGGPMLLVVSPLSAEAVLSVPTLTGTECVRMSRFTSVRARDGGLVAESGLGRHAVRLCRSETAGLLVGLAGPVRVADVQVPGLEPATVVAVLEHLVAAGVVVVSRPAAGGGTEFAEDVDPALVAWSPHELEFHTHSRTNRSGEPSGATYPWRGVVPPEPAIRPRPHGPRFALPRAAGPPAGGPSLEEALDEPVCGAGFAAGRDPTRAQLGGMLYRAARVRAIQPAPAATGAEYEISDRPYPSVALLYELELYLAVHRVQGLPRGIYHYGPVDHCVTLVNDDPAALDDVLGAVGAAAGLRTPPPALLSISSRMSRRSWVFPGIAHAASLMQLGVLHQTLRLAGIEVGLETRIVIDDAGAILDSALGLSWPAETTVGELLIGLPA